MGGNKGENTKALVIHGLGINNTRTRFDGSPVNNLIGAGGGNSHYFINTAYVQEMVLDTGAISAESETGGANLNIVPKDGGNRLSMYFLGNYTGESLQGDNFSDELRARGVTEVPPIHWIGDVGGGLGGPILKDNAVVLYGPSVLGLRRRAPGELFQQDAEYAVLRAGFQQAGQSQRDAARSHGPRDVAGGDETQGESHVQPPGKLPLLFRERHEPRAGSRDPL